jgi:hypothetical protein
MLLSLTFLSNDTITTLNIAVKIINLEPFF